MNQRDVEPKESQVAVRLSDVDFLVLEANRMRLVLSPKEGGVNFKHTMSPSDGWMSFPDGYFDEKESTVSQADMELISNTFDKLVLKNKIESKLEMLPPGAEPDAYLRAQVSGTNYFYTNTHVANGGYRVETEAVAEEFIQMIQLLNKYFVD